jgi:hypothetical protein
LWELDVPYIDADLVDDALAKVRAIEDDSWRAIALAGLSHHGDAILRERSRRPRRWISRRGARAR